MTLRISSQSFIERSLKLLDKERDAEIEETRSLTEKLPAKELQRRGVCLLKLHIGSRKSGLYGRTVIVLEPSHETLPSHCITPGDIVGLSPSNSSGTQDDLGSGIVTHVSQLSISIAFDESHDLFSLDDGISTYYKITKLANDVTYKRLKRTLHDLDKSVHGENAHLIDVLFGQAELSPPNPIKEITFLNGNLNDSQKDAVHFAISQKEIAIVHGPPGTGKTTTVIEIILQLVKQKQKVLACAPSNIAVDNLVERLAGSKHKILRLGHPARLLPHIQKYSLDAILSSSDESKLVEDVRKDLDKALSKLKKTNGKGERQKYREEMKHLRKELRQRTDAATREILKRAEVVLVTLTSATDDGPMKLLEENHFDTVVIDEVSQAMEAACWIPLLRSKKCILAGDHLQLPPTILSKEAAKEGLEVTLMERILDLYGDKVMKMLTIQYRMNEQIMNWSSEQLYESKLMAHESVKSHLLSDISGIENNEVTSTPLLFIDTAGCDMQELDLPEEISKGNEGEADIVSMHVRKLLSSGTRQEDIAVIAPYNLQVELIRWRLSKDYPKVEIKSVDGFQGREKEAVIISLVRSNPKGEVGFLSEKRRINVAVTRARRHLTVIGDSETVSNDTFLKSLVDYMNQHGDVETAHSYTQGEVGFLSEKRRINVAVTRARRHLTVIGDSETVSNDTFLKSLVDYMNQHGDVETAHSYTQDESFGVVGESRPEHLNDLMSLKTTVDKGARPKQPKVSAGNENKKKARKDNAGANSADKRKRDKPHKPENTEDSLAKRNEYQSQLEAFLADAGVKQLEFPSSLNSHDRLVIHELSEKLGLIHESKGDGSERHIVVSKPTTVNTVTEVDCEMVEKIQPSQGGSTQEQIVEKECQEHTNAGMVNGNNTEVASGDSRVEMVVKSVSTKDKDATLNEKSNNVRENTGNVSKSSDLIGCKECGKDVIKANIQLHEIHCAKRMKEEEKAGTGNKQKENKKKKGNIPKAAPSRQYDKELTKKMNNVDKDDFDALLNVVQKMDSSCCFKKCKTSVQTLFNTCMFCNGRYCMSHYIPEVHGCGEAARAQARSQIIKDGVLHRGSGVPDKRPDSVKKAHLQRKLDSKLADMSAKRKSKPKK